MFEKGVIIGNLERKMKEEWIQEDIYELKKSLFIGDDVNAMKLIGSIEMKSSDGEVLSELNMLKSLMY